MPPSLEMRSVNHGSAKDCSADDFRIPLRTFEDKHVVHLAPRVEHAGDGRDQKTRTNRPDIAAILDAEIGGEPGVEPWSSVPIQRVQIVPNRVDGVLACHRLNAAAHHPPWRGNPWS